MKPNSLKKIYHKNLSVVLQVLISLTLLFICLAIIFEIPHSKIATAIFTMIIGVIFLFMYGNELNKFHYIVGGYILLLDLWTYHNLDNMFSLSHSVFWVFLAFAIGHLVKRKKISYLTILIPFSAISALLFFSIVFQIEHINDGKFYFMNRNSIPVFAFTYGALMNVIWSRQHNSKPLLWPALVILLLSFLSKSRMGLLAGILYLSLITLTYLVPIIKKLCKESKKNKTKLVILLFLSLGLLVVIILMISNSRFSTVGFSSSGRIKIVRSYFSELTLKNLITGFNHNDINNLVNKSLHNSFLMLLMSTGLLSFPVFILYIVSGFRLYKKSYYLFGLFIILGIYSLVERFIFFGIGDFILIPILYLSFKVPDERTVQ